MTSPSQLKPRDFAWIYPSQEGRPFVLQEEGQDRARLLFHQQPEPSQGEYGGKKWLFHYTAVLHPRVTVTTEDDLDHVVAQFLPCWTGGGWVIFDSGARFRWRKAHIWGGGWCFQRMDAESSICLSQEAGPLTQGGKVSVCAAAADQPETPVLVLLAWFLRIVDFEMLVEGVFRVG
jgi:hypothetical protein